MAAKKKTEITEKEALVEVTKTILKKTTSKVGKIKIRPFVTDTATVGIKYGATIPTVDFGGVRVDVFLSSPCYKEEMLEVYKQLRKFADKLMDIEVEHLTGKGLEKK